MKKESNRENAGFTLIEVILSMAILALISLPLLGYFTDSIRYSRLMEQKQFATVLAQQTMEGLKAEEVLITTVEKNDGTRIYSVPFLLGPNAKLSAEETQDAAYYVNVNNTLNSEGKGSIVMKKSTGELDVVVSLNTDAAANSVSRPIVYSIDDTQDVLAIERDQFSEATIYFMALNSAYVTEKNAGISTEAGKAFVPLVVMTKDEIEKNMTREIYLSIDFADGFYRVVGNYVYTCTGVEGAGSAKTFTSSPIIDVKTANLRSIYMLYDIIHEEPLSNISTNKTPKKDILHVDNNTAEFPNLVVVCQNMDVSNINTYKFQIKCDKDPTLDAYTVRTNLNTSNISNSNGMPGNADKVKNLSEDGYPVRIVNLEVAVYPAGGYSVNPADCEEPYTVFTSTKGE